MKQSEQVILASQQPRLIDTSTKRMISKSSTQFQTHTFQQPVVTHRIHRKLIPIDGEAEETVVQPIQPPPQPIVHPVQQIIWPVAVQFNEDDALAKIREEKMLALLERQFEMLTNLLRIKELERENDEIWQRRRQNHLIYNVSQSVDQKLKEFNEFQMRSFLDQGQPVLLKPIHQDHRLFFDKKKKKPKPKKIVEVDDALVQDPDTVKLWNPKTGEIALKTYLFISIQVNQMFKIYIFKQYLYTITSSSLITKFIINQFLIFYTIIISASQNCIQFFNKNKSNFLLELKLKLLYLVQQKMLLYYINYDLHHSDQPNDVYRNEIINLHNLLCFRKC